jgi:hypothetical protein
MQMKICKSKTQKKEVSEDQQKETKFFYTKF